MAEHAACRFGCLNVITLERVPKPLASDIVPDFMTLLELSPMSERQLDMLLNDDRERRKWEAVTTAIDHLNVKYLYALIAGDVS